MVWMDGLPTSFVACSTIHVGVPSSFQVFLEWVTDFRFFRSLAIVVDETVYIIGGELHLKDGEDFFPTACE